jgi:hypothetical protein
MERGDDGGWSAAALRMERGDAEGGWSAATLREDGARRRRRMERARR